MLVFLNRVGNKLGLFSIPLIGGTLVQLNPDELTLKFDRFNLSTYFQITPDSSTVVFTAQNAREVFHLYAVPITGGAAIQLSPRLASGGNVTWFEITPNSGQVVYIADQNIDEQYGLFNVPLGGGDVIELTDKVHPSLSFYFSPDGNWVIYMVGDGSGRGVSVFSVPINGGSSAMLSRYIQIRDSNVAITPDSSSVLFLGTDPTPFGIKVAPIDGSPPQLRLAVRRNERFVVSPYGVWLAAADNADDGTRTIFVVPVAGGEPRIVTINPVTFTSSLDLNYSSWIQKAVFSPNSQYLVYFAVNSTGIPHLYSTSLYAETIALSSQTQLNAYPGSQRYNDHMLRITADSSLVIYTNDEEAENFVDIYAVPITGGEARRLTPDDSEGVVSFILYPPGTSWFTDFPQYY